MVKSRAMRFSILALLLIFLSSNVWAEPQTILLRGKPILTFDLPQVDFLKHKEKKRSRTYFSRTHHGGNLKLVVTAKGWLGADKLEQTYVEEKQRQRAGQYTRLNPDPKIPGARKCYAYFTTAPYKAQIIVLFTDEFRCELRLTGTKGAFQEVQPALEQLQKTLKVIPKNKPLDLEIFKK